MSAACSVCQDTGSLRDDGYYDCPHCSAAKERTELEAWADEKELWVNADDVWTIYKHGKAARNET